MGYTKQELGQLDTESMLQLAGENRVNLREEIIEFLYEKLNNIEDETPDENEHEDKTEQPEESITKELPKTESKETTLKKETMEREEPETNNLSGCKEGNRIEKLVHEIKELVPTGRIKEMSVRRVFWNSDSRMIIRYSGIYIETESKKDAEKITEGEVNNYKRKRKEIVDVNFWEIEYEIYYVYEIPVSKLKKEYADALESYLKIRLNGLKKS